MNVTIFSAFDTILNPYILLFKRAIERQGFGVNVKREFNLSWLFSEGKKSDVIHLHWLNSNYSLQEKGKEHFFLKRLIHYRFVKIVLEFVCLIDFVLAFIIAKATRKIITFTVHDLYEFGKKSLHRKYLIEIRRHIVFRFSNSIHVHNHYTRKLLKKKYKRRKGIFVIPHGNYIGFYTNTITKSKARDHLGLSDNCFVFLFLGLIRPYKGLEDLIEAFKKNNLPEARLMIVGRVFGVDNYESKLKALIRSDQRIKLIPKFIPDDSIQIYMNACDIFVLPYRDITTSGAAVLSLSFGRPIIAPSIASFPEIVTSETGILYDPQQKKALNVALDEAISKCYSEDAIFDYALQFDWDKLSPNFVTLYRNQL
jgi:glycosyltransferase involved in cell wall biosynthesis